MLWRDWRQTLQVTPTKLQITRSNFASLTADTNKFQLTNMLFVNF